MQHHHELQTNLLEADSEKDNAAPEPIEVCFNMYICINIYGIPVLCWSYNIEYVRRVK